MKRSLFLRIFAGYLGVVLILALTIPFVSFKLIREDHLKSTQEDLLNLGLAVQDSLLPLLGEHAALDRSVTELGQRLNKRITLVDLSGRVVADSGGRSEKMENHRDRPEIAEALKGRPGLSTRYSTTLGQDMLYVAQPLMKAGRQVGVIRLSCALAGINDLLERIRQHIVKLSLAITLMALLASFLFASLIARPVHALSQAARRVAGGDFTVRVASRSRDEVGELCRSFNDMTERLERYFSDLDSTKQTLESIIAAIPDVLLVVDSQGRIELLNESARRLTGLGAEAEPREHFYWEYLRAEEFTQALNRPNANGHEIKLGGNTYLMSLAKVAGTVNRVILLTDISELKRIEEVKRDLVVNVSHELRTPLTAIKGFTETMLDEDRYEPEYLTIIARHTERLINIVGDLLNLSELENGATCLDFAPVDLGELLHGLIKAFTDKAKGKGLDLKLVTAPEPLIIRADAFRLEQLFTNLIDNALKYTETGGVTVTLAQGPDGPTAKVADSGPGIAPEHLQRIFERFYVVDKSRSRKLGGTGLGLAIAKHIASLHGAELTVESRLGQGSTFSLRFAGPASSF